jgi:dipeptidyl aminopeptidase/acylaminoacyl peptidase
LWWKTVDDAAREERVTTGEGIDTVGSWSSDGQWFVYYVTDPITGYDIWALPSGGDRKPRAIGRTPAGEAAPRLSPDGRWLAYTSNESGRTEVLVQSFPEARGTTQISTRGGSEPVWSRDSRELFYLDGDAMMSVEIRTTPAFTAGTPRLLYEGRYVISPNTVASYDVSADGQRFLRVQPMHPDPPADRIHVALNWFQELKGPVSVR